MIGNLADSAIPFVCGLYATLLGYRVIGKRDDPKWEAWHRKWGVHLKWLGPVLVVISVMLLLIRTR